MRSSLLCGMPVDSVETLAEWLCIAFMQLKDNDGLLIGGRIPPDHALQIANMMFSTGIVSPNGGA